ncbi:putative pentatricopeptide repeat-containing protein At5g59200, chloroplastic [Aristolochia californica]|uniref:putative pentatricopeptide repeat-containing protein At5g59200, chloroplastic n=1 Tax=Aristolochia californica TaxID=171875 RepID=UPI0035DDF407
MSSISLNPCASSVQPIPLNLRERENRAVSLLQSSTTFRQITQIHAHIIRNSLHQNSYVAAKLVALCFSFKNPCYATRVFHQVPDPNHFVWNAMIKGLCLFGDYDDCLVSFVRLMNHGSRPDRFTFPVLFKACSKLAAAGEGEALHAHVLKLGMGADVFVLTALMDFYGSCHQSSAARRVFDRMSERDVVSWNAILASYFRCGLVELAKEVFEEMPEKNVSSWTTMIGGLVQNGNPREAVKLFPEMKMAGVKPDGKLIVTLLSAIADLGVLEMGQWIHDFVKKNGIGMDPYIATALIDMYSKCGNIREARLVFDGITSKTLSCYNAMIMGYAVQGMGKEAIKLLKQAERTEVGVDDFTMIAILIACSHSGLADEGCRYFKLMREVYGIEPKMEHYGCLVDLLGRAARFDDAIEMVESIDGDSLLLGTLAFACRVHGNLELGDKLTRKMSLTDPTNSGLLVLKSNLFAAKGEWEEAAAVRQLMREKGIGKKPGCSWIEVNNVVHEFVAADDSHPCSMQIYSKLIVLTEHMKSLGGNGK